ncbi:PIG-L deacetylase family protein [Stenotrophomonas sp. SAU14A_NAIMI4_8]|uniref:PIG-L deacetylase family protein n=1 Tax=Stenotrophomonas sp. SAU14A_NAIMI4_8 TaxID=2072409 RepID=UPI000D541C0E|nr:PIG-L deacetylase family protein [Stenotrophomonas sp. SAU14A_NAIMI4_8]AWH33933.1 PIG-L family deacetylase [Stenotrophomonas sp. SAU14A_NAIMI4_8]
MLTMKRALAIGAHPDDIELGCGGSIAKLASSGVDVHALILSMGREGATGSFDRAQESHRALVALGVKQVRQCDFRDTSLHQDLASIIKEIEEAVRAIQPDRVYTMFQGDRHQDHRTTFEASIVASRNVRQVLCYETPSSWPNFSPTIYEDIGPQLEPKIDALRLHRSQCDKSYMQKDQIRCAAAFRGQQVGCGPSEGFIPYRMVFE